MLAYPRAEIEEVWQRWLDTNAKCEESRDWSSLAEFYTPGATYGWNSGPDDEFMAVGRDEIRELAFGLEMRGLEGWTYPYQAVLIDDQQGMVLGLWKQVAAAKRDDGSNYEVPGLGGSWFGYAGEGLWAWQRDFYDVTNAGATFLAMMEAGVLSEGMRERIDGALRGERAPGHYRRAKLPTPLWPVQD